ncbi:L2 [Leptonychotes weddellii papillomavirus 4]|uniref:Minor capsid protein L2 n=1 Tax=Leptonychotes weddellii papillomavirus 4 TaxID=2077305 RepID=A0A2I8B2R1_9PAPI|nr:L2 [Leptonychotes weddellii papillomavirus 4]AUT11927.1 L2 [Leptonychotes weddellii papillomavirus 4]
MHRAKRVKRASAEDLYRTCKASGTCPDDVVNKVKWASSFLFFGGLGIGTGRGGGGTGGYVPLGSGGGVRPGGTGNVVRPSFPPDTIGPTDVLLPNTVVTGPDATYPEVIVDAGGPSVIEPVDVPDPGVDPSGLDLSVEDTSGGVITRGDTPGTFNQVEVFAEVHPAGPSLSVDTTVDTNDVHINQGPATIEVSNIAPPTRTTYSHSTFHNPAFEAPLLDAFSAGETSSTAHVFVTSGEGGHFLGVPAEEFELATYATSETTGPFEADTTFGTEGPRSSTPARPVRRGRLGYLGRRFRQVKVHDPTYLHAPRRLITYDNPVFEGEEDATLTFSPSSTRPAPEYEFTDLRVLHRPRYSLTGSGHVRVSRLGQRATLRTRSGAVIGQEVHYFSEVSSLHGEAPEAIELSSLGEVSGESIVLDSSAQGSVDDGMSSVTLTDEFLDTYPDSELLDEYEPVGDGAQLVLGTGRRRTTVTVSQGKAVRTFPGPVDVDNSSGYVVDSSKPAFPYTPFDDPSETPNLVIIDFGGSSDYFLHPSLLRKKRKRSYL